MLMIEETGMIIEQKITADIASDDVDIISLRSYFLAGLMSIEKLDRI